MEPHSLPPALAFFADFRIDVAEPITIAETPEGLRRMVPIIGGTIRGPSIAATILAAGEDTQLIRPDGSTIVDARYVARLDGGGSLLVANQGIRCGPPDVMARIARGEVVDPNEIYFRTTPRFETDVEGLVWVTRRLFVGVGARYPNRVEISVFAVA